MDESKLKPANGNPWYVLMTVHGEQEGPVIDQKLAERNRQAWNAWVAQPLSKEARKEELQSAKFSPDEIENWNDQYLEKAAYEVDRRGLDPKLIPDPAANAKLENLDILGALFWRHWLLPRGLTFENCKFHGQLSSFQSVAMGEIRFKNCDFHSKFVHRRLRSKNRVIHESCTFFEHVETDEMLNLELSFLKCSFLGGYKDFNHATGAATFQECRFDGPRVILDNPKGRTTFESCVFESDLRVIGDHGPDFRFVENRISARADFFGGKLSGRADFSRSVFEKPASFQGSSFPERYPLMGSTVFLTYDHFSTGDVSVGPDNASAGWPDPKGVLPGDRAEARETCGVIRHQMGKAGRPEDEHFFYRKEMWFAGHGTDPIARRLPYLAFEFLSMFGHSIMRPVLCLAVNVVIGWLVYLAWFDCGATFQGETHTWAEALALSITNSFAFLGFHRLYFGYDYFASLPDLMNVAGAVQSVLGIVFLFFLGLGLRTRFRLR